MIEKNIDNAGEKPAFTEHCRKCGTKIPVQKTGEGKFTCPNCKINWFYGYFEAIGHFKHEIDDHFPAPIVMGGLSFAVYPIEMQLCRKCGEVFPKEQVCPKLIELALNITLEELGELGPKTIEKCCEFLTKNKPSLESYIRRFCDSQPQNRDDTDFSFEPQIRANQSRKAI